MRALIEHIANMLRIDLKDPYALADIAQVKELEGFKTFIEENFNDMRLKFANPIEKFLLLRKMYYEELNSDRLEKAENNAFLLAEKFRVLKPTIKRMFEEFKTPLLENFEKTDGAKYFEPFELKTLTKLGDVRKLVFFDDNMLLEKKISKEFTDRVYLSTQKAIQHSKISTNDTSNDKRLIPHIQNALNRF